MTDILLKGCSLGTIGGCSENGWVTSELFLKWLKHFGAIWGKTATLYKMGFYYLQIPCC